MIRRQIIAVLPGACSLLNFTALENQIFRVQLGEAFRPMA